MYPKDKPTLQAAIREKLASGNMTFIPGTKIVRRTGSPSNSNPTNIDQEVNINSAVAAARSSDVVILALGEGSYTEGMGNIDALTLPEVQLKLADAIIATGKPVVLVFVEGRPRVISRIADKVDAIVMAYNPSNEGGRAIADVLFGVSTARAFLAAAVLFGDFNPEGKLPITYPRSAGYFPTYDAPAFGKFQEGAAFSPQFEFGYGLSYTTFEYSDLQLSADSIGSADSMNVSFRVTNTGKRPGGETAIVYLRDEVASMTPSAKRVRHFAKLYLDPGESRVVTFTLDRQDLSFIDTTNQAIVEPGDFTVLVGGLAATFILR